MLWIFFNSLAHFFYSQSICRGIDADEALVKQDYCLHSIQMFIRLVIFRYYLFREFKYSFSFVVLPALSEGSPIMDKHSQSFEFVWKSARYHLADLYQLLVFLKGQINEGEG